MLGRLTLNPIKHIDLIGTIVVPALTVSLGGFIFGWAKPVPITWRNLKHARRDMALVALAGPLSNFLMALLWAGIAKTGMMLEAHQIISGVALVAMGKVGIYVNSILMLLNLLPLQPLDGGRVASSLLPGKLSYYFDRVEPYGFIILLVLLATGILGNVLGPLLQMMVSLIGEIFGL
jgi:Zn-dependent protease